MILKFTVNFFDLYKYNIAYQLRSPAYHAVSLLVPLIVLWLGLKENENTIIGVALFSTIVFLITWIAQILFILPILYFRNNSATATSFELEISEAGIIEESQLAIKRHNWPGVFSIKPGFGLYIIDLSSGDAVLVPYRTFKDESEKIQFRNLVDDYISNQTPPS